MQKSHATPDGRPHLRPANCPANPAWIHFARVLILLTLFSVGSLSALTEVGRGGQRLESLVLDALRVQGLTGSAVSVCGDRAVFHLANLIGAGRVEGQQFYPDCTKYPKTTSVTCSEEPETDLVQKKSGVPGRDEKPSIEAPVKCEVIPFGNIKNPLIIRGKGRDPLEPNDFLTNRGTEPDLIQLLYQLGHPRFQRNRIAICNEERDPIVKVFLGDLRNSLPKLHWKEGCDRGSKEGLLTCNRIGCRLYEPEFQGEPQGFKDLWLTPVPESGARTAGTTTDYGGRPVGTFKEELKVDPNKQRLPSAASANDIWAEVKASGAITELATFLVQFPEGDWAALAKSRILSLAKEPMDCGISNLETRLQQVQEDPLNEYGLNDYRDRISRSALERCGTPDLLFLHGADSIRRKELQSGVFWLRAASYLGNAKAAKLLGDFYQADGASREFDASLRYYYLAGQLGSGAALNQLGLLVEKGTATKEHLASLGIRPPSSVELTPTPPDWDCWYVAAAKLGDDWGHHNHIQSLMTRAKTASPPTERAWLLAETVRWSEILDSKWTYGDVRSAVNKLGDQAFDMMAPDEQKKHLTWLAGAFGISTITVAVPELSTRRHDYELRHGDQAGNRLYLLYRLGAEKLPAQVSESILREAAEAGSEDARKTLAQLSPK